MYSPACYISLILDGVSPVVELTEITLPSLWPVEPFKDFWEEKNFIIVREIFKLSQVAEIVF